jgi:hypothetical protein
MRKYLILFALCIFFFVISYYLVTTLNPFNEEQIAQLVRSENIQVSEEFQQVVTELVDKGLIMEFLNMRNVFLLGTTISLAILAGFMFIHTVLDKLFFRKFYEQPSMILALRRGSLVCLGLISLFVYRLFAAEWYLAVLTLSLLVIVEVVIGRLAPAKLNSDQLAADEDKTEGTAVDADLQSVSPRMELKQRLHMRLADIKLWPQQFRETVMRQVAETYTDMDNTDTDADLNINLNSDENGQDT